ncbi:hypothetical protein S245_055401, partial [Arachis hypogaea]
MFFVEELGLEQGGSGERGEGELFEFWVLGELGIENLGFHFSAKANQISRIAPSIHRLPLHLSSLGRCCGSMLAAMLVQGRVYVKLLPLVRAVFSAFLMSTAMVLVCVRTPGLMSAVVHMCKLIFLMVVNNGSFRGIRRKIEDR